LGGEKFCKQLIGGPGKGKGGGKESKKDGGIRTKERRTCTTKKKKKEYEGGKRCGREKPINPEQILKSKKKKRG